MKSLLHDKLLKTVPKAASDMAMTSKRPERMHCTTPSKAHSTGCTGDFLEPQRLCSDSMIGWDISLVRKDNGMLPNRAPVAKSHSSRDWARTLMNTLTGSIMMTNCTRTILSETFRDVRAGVRTCPDPEHLSPPSPPKLQYWTSCATQYESKIRNCPLPVKTQRVAQKDEHRRLHEGSP